MYAIMNIIGPILLIAVLIFVTVKTWTRKGLLTLRSRLGDLL